MSDTTSMLAAPGGAEPGNSSGFGLLRRRWPLAVLGGGLLFETLVLVSASGRADDLSHLTNLGLWLWWAIPFLLSGILVWLVDGRTRISWWWTAGLAITITLAGVGGYLQMLWAADASLIGLSGPLVQDAAVIAVGIVVIVAEGAARRRGRSC